MGEVEKNSFIALPGRGLMPSKIVCSNLGGWAGFGEEFYSNGSRPGLLIKIRVSTEPVLLSSGLRWSPDELLWFSRISNCALLSGMKNASSSC